MPAPHSHRFVPSAPPDPLRRPGAPPPVCRRGTRDPHFAGRDDELEEVGELLASKPVLLTDGEGMERSGKTAFALEYCHRFGQRYTVIWWFDCRSGDGLSAQKAALREAVGAVAAPGRWWLTVYDGVRSDGDLDGHVPEGPGHVLITCAGETAVPGALPYPLGPLTLEESVILLMRKAPELNPVQAVRLAEGLGRRPALLSRVGELLLEAPGLGVDACLELMRLGGSLAPPAAPAVPVAPVVPDAPVVPAVPDAPVVPAPRPPVAGEGPAPAEPVPTALKAQLVDALYRVEALSNGGVEMWIKLIGDQLGTLDIGGDTMRAKLVNVVRRCLLHGDGAMLDEMVAALRVMAPENDPALPDVVDHVGRIRRIRYP
ncbi:effector-associated domain 2-containing protein [Actinomadura rugatobispora]|uniref:Effector-associated domain-containing protein n=1 Tax=Actinomadura rugatobispora TaxID=1994 RepID=A0ABW1AJ76_9ACTN|nr:hypothetical protein GCM10010200_022520 [Actinomadura rugatobispora]